MVMKLVETIGLDGSVAETYKVCSICGFVSWSDICETERIFGKCEPRQDHRRVRKGKYRRTPRSQTDLYGRNLREAFWGSGVPR